VARHRRYESDDTPIARSGSGAALAVADPASRRPARLGFAAMQSDARSAHDRCGVSSLETVDLTELLGPLRLSYPAPWERRWCWAPPTDEPAPEPVSVVGGDRRRPNGVTVLLAAVACGALVAGGAISPDGPRTAGKSPSDVAAVVARASPTRRQAFLPPPPRAAPTAARTRLTPRRPRSVTPVVGVVTSGYGMRWGTEHYGLDIANDIGTPIFSVSDGVILNSGPASGFGLWVRIRHDDGTTAVYGHINETLVAVGQRVRAGQQIATVGNRGISTGPHLHFEVWQGDSVRLDPAAWLRARGVVFQ